jgi:hypothetical protein
LTPSTVNPRRPGPVFPEDEGREVVSGGCIVIRYTMIPRENNVIEMDKEVIIPPSISIVVDDRLHSTESFFAGNAIFCDRDARSLLSSPPLRQGRRRDFSEAEQRQIPSGGGAKHEEREANRDAPPPALARGGRHWHRFRFRRLGTLYLHTYFLWGEAFILGSISMIAEVSFCNHWDD